MFDEAPEHIKNKAIAELRSYLKKLPQPMRERLAEKYSKDLLEEIVKSYIVNGQYRRETK